MKSDEFWVIFDISSYHNQMTYYINLFSKIRWSLTYLPTLTFTSNADASYAKSGKMTQMAETAKMSKWVFKTSQRYTKVMHADLFSKQPLRNA